MRARVRVYARAINIFGVRLTLLVRNQKKHSTDKHADQNIVITIVCNARICRARVLLWREASVDETEEEKGRRNYFWTPLWRN